MKMLTCPSVAGVESSRDFTTGHRSCSTRFLLNGERGADKDGTISQETGCKTKAALRLPAKIQGVARPHGNRMALL